MYKKEIRFPSFDVGRTTIASAFPETDLIGYVEASKAIVYVDEKFRLKVQKSLLAVTQDDGTWLIKIGDRRRKYTVTTIQTLDRSKLLDTDDFAVINDWICTAIHTSGKCVDMYDVATGAFTGSIKVPDGGLSYCAPQEGATCKRMIKKYTGEVWPQKGCKGNSNKNGTIDLGICPDDLE